MTIDGEHFHAGDAYFPGDKVTIKYYSVRVVTTEETTTPVGTSAEYGLFTDSWNYGNYDLKYFSYGRTLAGEFTSEKDIKAPKLCDSDVRFFYERAESLK